MKFFEIINAHKNIGSEVIKYIHSKNKNTEIKDNSMNKIMSKLYEIKNTYSYVDFSNQIESAKSQLLDFHSEGVRSKIQSVIIKVENTSNTESLSECIYTIGNHKKNNLSLIKTPLKKVILLYKDKPTYIKSEDTLTDIVKLKKSNTRVSNKTVRAINKRVDKMLDGKSKDEAKCEMKKIQDIIVEGKLKRTAHIKIMKSLNKKRNGIDNILKTYPKLSLPVGKVSESKEKQSNALLLSVKNESSLKYSELDMEIDYLPKYKILKMILIETLKDKGIENKGVEKILKHLSYLEHQVGYDKLKIKLYLTTKLINRDGLFLDKHCIDLYLMDRLNLPVKNLILIINGLTS